MSYYSYEIGRRDDKSRIDALVDWYEKNKSEAGKTIKVDLGPKKLAKAIGFVFAKDTKNKVVVVREIPYRGRTLVAIGNDPEPRG